MNKQNKDNQSMATIKQNNYDKSIFRKMWIAIFKIIGLTIIIIILLIVLYYIVRYRLIDFIIKSR